MRKLCPNCESQSLMISRTVDGDIPDMIYCKCCHWSEPEERDDTLRNIVTQLDMVFNFYAESMKNNMDVSSGDVNNLIKQLYKYVVEKS